MYPAARTLNRMIQQTLYSLKRQYGATVSVYRLRDAQTGDRPIVLRTELGAGHGGPSGRYDAWRDEARTLAFLLATT